MIIVREYINEKFTDESDPIKDLGIGIRHKIKQWLDEMCIRNYTINKDLTINVNDCVNLDNGLIKTGKLPDYIQFNMINGCFWIRHNNLTTLKGCPKKIVSNSDYNGSFRCSHNNLLSLEYAPISVDYDFECGYNPGNFTKEDVLKICKVGNNVEV